MRHRLLPDLIVGAPFYSGAQTPLIGRAYVFHGEASPPASIDLWDGDVANRWFVGEGSVGVNEQDNDYFGNAVAGGVDVNDDGQDDIIVGAYYYTSSGDSEEYRGRVYYFYSP